MDNTHNHPVDVDPEAFARAKETYRAFTHASKWAVMIIAIGVVLLALITL